MEINTHNIIEFLTRSRITRRLKRKWKVERDVVKDKKYPALSRREMEEIDRFWRNYGIKIPDYSAFQMYYAVSGIRSPRFVPRTIALLLETYYNDKDALYGWDNKNAYELLMPSLSFPKAFCHYIHGFLYDEAWNQYSCDKASMTTLSSAIFAGLPENCQLIMKKSANTYAGLGVKKVSVASEEDILALLESNVKDGDFIVQECIQQSSFLQQFNPSSVNMFRIITFRTEESIEVLSASLRFGIEGFHTDVAFVGGKEIANVVGIDLNTGCLNDRLFDIDCEKPFDKYAEIKDRKVPALDKMIELATEAHRRLLFFDIVGWDFTLDVNDTPICLEYNIEFPGTQMYQFANGPLAGEHTDEYLSPLRSERVRRLIPRRFRC